MTTRSAAAVLTGLRHGLYPLLALPVGVACLALTAVDPGRAISLQCGLLRRLLGLPVAPSAESLRGAWGGPSLGGAWAVHAVGGTLVFLLAGLPILYGVAWLQGRLARAVLTPTRSPVPGSPPT